MLFYSNTPISALGACQPYEYQCNFRCNIYLIIINLVFNAASDNFDSVFLVPSEEFLLYRRPIEDPVEGVPGTDNIKILSEFKEELVA